MSAEKTEAIVLKIVDFSESSCIVTMYTRDFGRIGALAKGARRLKSPFEGAIDLLSTSRIVFLLKSSNRLDLLTEAKLERRFRSAEKDLRRLYLGYYLIELMLAFTDEHDSNPELFDLLNQTVVDLDQGVALVPLMLRFEIMMLRLTGQMPSLKYCVGCGRIVELSSRTPFGLISGGVICESCRIGHQQIIRVSKGVLEMIGRFGEPENENWRNVEIPAEVRGELRAVVNRYLTHLLGREPKMRPFFKQIVSY